MIKSINYHNVEKIILYTLRKVIILFFLCILIVLFIILIMFFCSTIKIEINNIFVNFPKINGKYVNKHNSVILQFFLFGKIKIFAKNLSNIKVDKEKFNKQINNIRKKVKEKKLKNIESIKNLKQLDIRIEKMDLKICLGVEDAAITAVLIGIVSGFVAILLGSKMNDLSKQIYIVEPVYNNKNILNIKFDGIIAIDIRHIIIIIFKLLTRREKKNDRTSYRRSYVYSNE